MKTTSLFPPLFSIALLAGACGPTAPGDDESTTVEQGVASAITWRAGAASRLDGTTGPATSIQVAKPAGTAAGDFEIAVIATYDWITVTPPSGWKLLRLQADTGSAAPGPGISTTIFGRTAAAGEPSAYAFGFSAKARAIATIQSYANVDTASPIDAEASISETTIRTDHKTPSITTSANGDVLVGIFGTKNPKEPASNTSTMAHERLDQSSGDAGSWGIGLALYDTDPRNGPAKESARVAVSSSGTDTATMTLVALRPKSKQLTATRFGAGFSPHSNERYDELIDQWGGMGVSRSYDGGSGVTPFLNKYQAQDIARGAASAYSFKYPPAEVIAGQHDATLKSFFQGIADGHPVYWTYFHEPDDQLYVKHDFTPTQYRNAWAHIRSLADGVKAGRPNLQIFATLIIMEYSMRPGVADKRPLLGSNGMYPGDAVIDVFGVDSYNSAADQGGIADASRWDKVVDFAKAHGKAWAIGELGSCPVVGDPGARAQFLTNSIQHWIELGYPPAYVAYFDLQWPSCDYRLDNDPAATKVWHDAVTLGLSAFD